MQEQAWVAVLRRIPAAYHDGLILSTNTGVDVVLQAVIRVEDDFLILRGRPAGTNEAGKVMIIPYSHINFISLPGKPKESEVLAIFGDRDVAFATLPEVLPEVSSRPVAPEPVPDEPAPLASNGMADEKGQETPIPKAPPSKTFLLAKLRAKLNGQDNKSGHGK